MLNNSLTAETYRKIVNLKSSNPSTNKAIVALLENELNETTNGIFQADTMNDVCRAQGAATQLKSLIKLFETPEGFKELFTE